MSNMYANRVVRNGSSRPAKGRESTMVAMVASAVTHGKFMCHYCGKFGHRIKYCFKLRDKMGSESPVNRKGDWCSVHNTSLHNNSDCRIQQNHNGSNGKKRDGQRPNRQQYRKGRGQKGQRRQFNNNNGSYHTTLYSRTPTLRTSWIRRRRYLLLYRLHQLPPQQPPSPLKLPLRLQPAWGFSTLQLRLSPAPPHR